MTVEPGRAGDEGGRPGRSPRAPEAADGRGDGPATGRGPGRRGSGPADAWQIERRERVGAARFARRTPRSEQHAPDDTARDAMPWRAPTSRICESGHRPGASGSTAPKSRSRHISLLPIIYIMLTTVGSGLLRTTTAGRLSGSTSSHPYSFPYRCDLTTGSRGTGPTLLDPSRADPDFGSIRPRGRIASVKRSPQQSPSALRRYTACRRVRCDDTMWSTSRARSARGASCRVMHGWRYG